MADEFLVSLRERLADLLDQQTRARHRATDHAERLIINAEVGLLQAIIHDYEQFTAPLYADGNQRRRVSSRAIAFADSPMSEITVKQGEAEARLIVRRLEARGVAAEVEQRGEKWIVRKGERE